MNILNIIDSLELNGGSTMFLEMSCAMQKYWKDDQITPYVVSKTGGLGRDGLVCDDMAKSYGVDINVCNYDTFERSILPKLRNSVIFHHVLGYTKSLLFHPSCKYIVINHVATNLQRLPKFHASKLVCVSGYFKKKAIEGNRKHRLSPLVILNGCEDYSDIEPSAQSDKFVVGRCQRIVPTKFCNEPIHNMEGITQYVIGLFKEEYSSLLPKNAKIFGPIFDKGKKIPIIRSFNAYLHGAARPEGCSMAILESLSCGIPVIVKESRGGVNEVIKHGFNGFFYKNIIELKRILNNMVNNKDLYQHIKNNVRRDFLNRFHIKKTLDQYRKLI